jgi:hypothetical protein
MSKKEKIFRYIAGVLVGLTGLLLIFLLLHVIDKMRLPWELRFLISICVAYFPTYPIAKAVVTIFP